MFDSENFSQSYFTICAPFGLFVNRSENQFRGGHKSNFILSMTDNQIFQIKKMKIWVRQLSHTIEDLNTYLFLLSFLKDLWGKISASRHLYCNKYISNANEKIANSNKSSDLFVFAIFPQRGLCKSEGNANKEKIEKTY